MSEDPLPLPLLIVLEAKKKLVETAHGILSGQLSAIEGAREIRRLWYRAELPYDDPDLTPFDAVDTETDALPLGQLRELWAPDALSRLQPEIDRAEKWARNLVESPCRNLVTRFGKSELS